jgi:hypothetical protein
MSSVNPYNLYKKKENIYPSLNSRRENNNKYKTRQDLLSHNLNYNQNPKVYIKLDPEYLENNYKNEERQFDPNYKDNSFSYNLNNNNSTIGNIFKKKSPYLKEEQNTNSPIKLKKKNLIYGNKTLDDIKRKRNSINDNNNNEYKTISPIKKYIEKKNFNFYINNGIYAQGNNNIKEDVYPNKSLELNNLYNNRYNFNNINEQYIKTETERNRTLPYFKINIYQKKMVNIFIQIINKVLQRHKKKDILNSFFDKLKQYYSDKNDFKHKFQKKNTKYNEYKNIINNYVKTSNNNSKNDNEFSKNIKNRNKNINTERNNNSSLKPQKTDYSLNDKKRLKELQKKYDKIYEKKKNSTISVDDKYLDYMLRKTKTQYDLSKINKNNNNESLIGQNKTKLLKNKLISYVNTNRNKPYSNSKKFNSFSKFKENFEDNFNIGTPSKSNSRNSNKIITKRLKITPKISKNIKEEKENINNKKEENYEIYNIKDIITPDKRLYVYINYITLNNKDKSKKFRLDYYNDDLLKISNEININLYGLNKKKKRFKSSNYFIKNSKILSKIEEEPFEKNNNNNISNNDKQNEINKNNVNMGEAILILEKYKNKLKKETVKKNIDNYKK